jgi:hypothetical protein
VVNSLNLLVAVQGLTLPDGEPWYDLTSHRFFFTPEDLAAAKRSQSPGSGAGSELPCVLPLPPFIVIRIT